MKKKNWFVPALGATVLYGVMQLCFRGLGERTEPVVVYLAVFGLSWLYYRYELTKVVQTPIKSAPIIAAALLCAAGNYLAFLAVKAAPNPGYAVALFGVQAIIVLVVGVVRGGLKSISLVKVVGVLMTVIGAAVISAFGESTTSSSSSANSFAWVIYAMSAALLFAIEFMAFKKVQAVFEAVGSKDVALASRESIWRWVTIIYLLAALVLRPEIPSSLMVVMLLLVATACSCVANILSFNAIKIAPNLGFLLAIFATQALLVALGSVLVFDAELTILGIIGMIPCVFGVVLLSKES